MFYWLEAYEVGSMQVFIGQGLLLTRTDGGFGASKCKVRGTEKLQV